MGILKTVVKAHVATRVIGSTHRRQQQRWAAQDAASTTQSAPTTRPNASTVNGQDGTSSKLEQLTQLGQLRDSGVLTEAEFEAEKQRILSS